MSNASRCSRYYARRRALEAQLLAEVADLKAEIFRLKEHVNMVEKQNQELTDRVNMKGQRVNTHVNAEIVEKQRLRQSAPRARVEVDSPREESSGKRKKHISRSPTASPEFDAFWAIWPNKVCKQKAFESYGKALERVNMAELLEGVRRYVATKPDSQQWCHAATWLNQDRWTDQPAPPVRQRMNGGGSNYSGLF